MRRAIEIQLTKSEQSTLTKWSRSRRIPVRQAQRARMILLAAKGYSNSDIAEEMGIKRHTVGRWRDRFSEHRLPGIEKDLPRGGRPRANEEIKSEIIRMTTQESPANATHWSTRLLAEEMGITQSMVHRTWKANGLKPHLVKTFKVSNDPRFEEKLRDVVGLYLNPPENALVLSADEKTSIQALDRLRRAFRWSRVDAAP